MFLNTYRVMFVAADGERRSLWVMARNMGMAIVDATMLAMGGTGNEDAEAVGEWIRTGNAFDVSAVIESN